MKFVVYTVHDRKAETFAEPFVQRSGAVNRTLKEIFSRSPMPPSDFDLYVVGEFDNETGILSTSTPVKVSSIDLLISDPIKEVVE